MKTITKQFSVILFGCFIFSMFLICVTAIPSQSRPPREIVDEVLKTFIAPFPSDDEYYIPFREKIKKDLKGSGKEGFEYLVDVTKMASTPDLYRLIPLLNYFNGGEMDGSQLVDLIRERGSKAKDKNDLMTVAPLYANIGFNKLTPQVTQFLFDVIAKKNQIANDWPIIHELRIRKSIREMDESEDLIRTFAVLSLIHANTQETISFLKQMRYSDDISAGLKETISFYFQKVEEFGSLEKYYDSLPKSFL